MSRIKFAKICISEWENASRDKRELSVVSEFDNVDITVYAKGDLTGAIDTVDGFKVKRISTRPLGTKAPNSLNRLLSMFTWANYIRKEKVDVISGHDVIALCIGYLSNLLKRNKAKLVYDSHEFEAGRNAKRSKFTTWVILKLEKELMKKASFSIMVSDSIAEEVRRLHKQAEKATVVRNIPNCWKLDLAEIEKTRRKILEKMKEPKKPFIVMYHGAVVKYRGADKMIEAISQLDDVVGVVLGNGDIKYIEDLKNLSKKLNIENRVLFLNAVPIEELYKYVGASDVGMVTVEPVNKSYYYMMPNKFFENIQSLTPVIVSNFPDIGKIVDEYGIGKKVDPEDVNEIAKAIESMKENKKLYQGYKRNIDIAKQELCWENEKEVLYEAYLKVISCKLA